MEFENLITSPFGIGLQLIMELLKKGEKVFSVFPSPKDVPMSLLGKTNLKCGFLKFGQDTNLERILPKKVKNVFHTHEVYSGSFPHIFRSNTLATLLLLDWARSSGVARFIYLSNGEVYGQGKSLTDQDAYDPRSFYATTKYEAEILLKYYHRSFDASVVRVFFPFGKDQHDGHIAGIIQSIKNEGSIDTEYDKIGPTFIDDIVEPVIRIREVKGNDIIIFSGEPVKTDVIIDEIKRICGRSPKKVNTGRLELFGDSSKAREILNYQATPFEDAVKRTLAT
jgi:nucleoside-diphosphate-sugar epimerase